MPLSQVKIYNDGSHFIGIPKENFPRRKSRNRPKPPKPQEGEKAETPKEKFEKAYSESQSLPRREQKKYIKEQLKDTFPMKRNGKSLSKKTLKGRKKTLSGGASDYGAK